MKIKLKLINFCYLLFLSPFIASGQSGNTSTLGKGLHFEAADSSFAVKFNVRIQSLYSGVYNLDTENYSDNLQVRRARLKMEGFVYKPELEYKLELGLSNSDIGNVLPETNNTANVVLDAFVRWKLAGGWNILFGQTKLPGNRERVTSSQKLQFVDRSLLNSRYNLDRDAGIQFRQESKSGKFIFRKMAAISMGEGRNITAHNKGGYNYTGRIELLPFGEFASEGDYFGSDLKREKKPKLSLGISYDYNDRASRQSGQLGNFLAEKRDLKTLFADAMFKYQGFSAMAEYADRRTNGNPVVELNPDGSVAHAFFTGKGYNIQAGYLFKNNVELAGRYTMVDPEDITQRINSDQYTLGLSKFIVGHTVKVQSDVSLLDEGLDLTELMYRFQVEIGF